MADMKTEFFKTSEYPRAGSEPSTLVYKENKIIGTEVKVMRTGQVEPDVGWTIAEVYFRDARKKINRTLVKVRKPNDLEPQKGLQKVVPLELLERINPEIKFLIFETDKDYVLYLDQHQDYKIGLVVDIDFEDEYVTVLLDEGGNDITASQDRVALAHIIDKNDDPRQLEKVLHTKIKL